MLRHITHRPTFANKLWRCATKLWLGLKHTHIQNVTSTPAFKGVGALNVMFVCVWIFVFASVVEDFFSLCELSRFVSCFCHVCITFLPCFLVFPTFWFLSIVFVILLNLIIYHDISDIMLLYFIFVKVWQWFYYVWYLFYCVSQFFYHVWQIYCIIFDNYCIIFYYISQYFTMFDNMCIMFYCVRQ